MKATNKLKNHQGMQTLQIELEVCTHRTLRKQLIAVTTSRSTTIIIHSIILTTVATTITTVSIDLATIASITTTIISIVPVQQLITRTSHCINCMKMIQSAVLTMMYSRAL